MFRIIKKKELNKSVTLMEVEAPLVAAAAKAGQFVILRVDEDGERIPFTIFSANKDKGTVSVIFQIVGGSTLALSRLEEGDCICDFAGPLGRATEVDGYKSVAVIGGGVGCAIAYPVAKALKESGARVTGIAGFRSCDLVILEDEFKSLCDRFVLMTDDGSKGEKGLVTNALEKAIAEGERFDCVFAIGPLVMMKFVSLLTKKYGIKTVVSMNPIMVDGTGMCGGCRLTVGGEMKFACVDGPDFDGHQVDFDECIRRSAIYKDAERHAYGEDCNLMKGAKNNG